MRIFISKIPEDGLALNVRERISPEEFSITTPVTGGLRVRKVENRVLVDGELSCRAGFQCSRCLGDFEGAVDSRLSVEYRPAPEQDEAEEHELQAGELDVIFHEGDELDLSELVMEQVLLAVPMSPVCSDSCKGLCPVCGGNLNERQCDCDTRYIDPRLKVLMKLKGEV
ncbi:MAG: DUF177 domain-containing protein [Nitrospirae bacterium]|nr:DUF177 domain-containing protein [Nitrospirota bacterium]